MRIKTSRILLGSILISATILGGTIGALAQQTQYAPGMMGLGMMGQHIMGPGMMPMGGGMGGCPMMGQYMTSSGHGPTMMGPGMMIYGPAIEGRLAYVKAELGITDAQTAAWDGYVTAVKSRMAAMQGTHQA
jgi:hypothetical protein